MQIVNFFKILGFIVIRSINDLTYFVDTIAKTNPIPLIILSMYEFPSPK